MKVTRRETRPGEMFFGGSGVLIPYRPPRNEAPAVNPLHYPMFERYADAVRRYEGDASAADLLMASAGRVSVHYAPFDWINPAAKLVIVGITPGRLQAQNALAEAKRALAAGEPVDTVLRRAKTTAAFSGALRNNLVALLDHIGLQRWLGVGSCEALFGASAHLVQTTSMLQFPVFVDGGKNYNGSPSPTEDPLLRGMLLDHFGASVKHLGAAVFLPLGPVVTGALEWLAAQGVLDPRRVLSGLPHPSGANAERIAYFLGRKSRESLSAKTDAAKIDAARERVMEAVKGL